MLFLSSIFSFETLTERPKLSSSVIVALFLCAFVRLLFAFSSEALDEFPGQYDARGFMGIEKYFIGEPETSPQILFFGSSRVRYSIAPEVFAQHTDVAPSSVQNLALDMGGPWDVLCLLERNPRLFDEAKLVIIDCNCWQFNAGYETFPTPRFYRLATLRERIQSCSGVERIKWALDVVWPFMLERRNLRQWAGGALQRVMGGGLSVPYPERWDSENGGHMNPGFYPKASAKRHTKDFEVDETVIKHWNTLVGTLSDRRIRLLIVRPPTQGEYLRTIRTDPQSSEAYDTYLRLVENLAGDGVFVQLWELPSECGLSDDDFIDYGHLNERGAEKFTQFLSEFLLENNLLGGTTGDNG